MTTYSEPIARFPFFKDRRKNVVAVSIQEIVPDNGKPLVVVDVRLFAMNRAGANVPTPKGVTMSVKRLRNLHDAVSRAVLKAESLGLLSGPAADGEEP